MTALNSPPAGTTRAFGRGPDTVLWVVELSVMALVLCLAWKAWSVWPTVPISDPDTWGYLNPALSWLSGQGFRQTDGRDWLYPAFVALFLKTTGSFHGIVVWQKLLAFLSGILMAVTWRCWVSMQPLNRWGRIAFSVVGAVPIYIQLINQQNFFFVMSIRPEAVLTFFVYVQLACLMLYCKYRWQIPREIPSMLFGAAAIALAYGCYLLKPSWYFAFATTSAPVIVGIFGKALSRKPRFLTPVLGVAVAGLFLWLPARIWFIRDGASKTLLPDALFCVHAELIDKLLESRLAAMPDSAPERVKLQTLTNALESEIRDAKKGRRIYAKLIIDADYLMHSHNLSAAISDYTGNDRGKFSSFCFASYFGAVFHYPLEYAKKVAEQFEYFLFPEPATFFKDQMNLIKPYKGSAESMAAYAKNSFRPDLQEMFRGYREETTVLLGSVTTLDRDRRLHNVAKASPKWTLPLELLFFVAWAVAIFWRPLHPFRLGGWATFCLFLAPFGNAFGVCIVHTLDIYRYRVTYGGYLLTAVAAMTLFTIAVVSSSAWKLVRKTGRDGAAL
jgi:hypothetical protein